MFVSENLCVAPTANTNGSLLKVDDTTLTKMKTKPVFSKSRIRSKFKTNPLTVVRSNRAKNNLNPQLKRYLKKPKPKENKSVDSTGSACTNTKNPRIIAKKVK